MKLKSLSVYLAEKNISQETFDALTDVEKANHFDLLNEENENAIKEEIKNKNEEAVKAMKAEFEEMYGEQYKTLNKAFRDLALAVRNSQLEKGEELNERSIEFKKIKDTLRNIAKGEAGSVEIKATTNIASVQSNTSGFVIPDVGQLPTAQRNAYAIFPKMTISDGQNLNGIIKYWDWDEATTVRNASMIAESGTYTESTAKWKQYTLDIKKVGDTLPITEEFVEDEGLFYAELDMFLRTNVDIKINDQIVNGDGTGNNLTGAFASVSAYTAVASGITDASIYDLIVKLKEDIQADKGGKYNVNFALMNLVDINKMKLKKDANNNYVLPPFVDRSGNVVDGLTIVEDNTVTADTMLIGDSRFARIYERTGVEVSKGVVGNQFVEDEMTLKIRKRLAFLIREVDKSGFLKVTSIAADLVTLAL